MNWITEKLLPALDVKDCVTVPALATQTGEEKKRVARSCGILHARGLIERVETGCYRITKLGRIAVNEGKRVRTGPAGALTGRRKPRKNHLRERVWKSLRQLRKATAYELVQDSVKGEERDAIGNARRYLGQLAAAGYVSKLEAREPGTAPTSNGFARYVLVKDTGPGAPVYSQVNGTFYDPNTGETFAVKTGGAA